MSTSGDTAAYSAEIYSPAYLFKGPRPSVTSAPTSIAYNEAFAVATPDTERVVAVNLIRLGSVTHAFNMDQRINRLPFTVTATGLSVTAPATTALAPAGYYMMFLIDSAGVPSVASFVRLTDGALDPVEPALTVSAPAEGARLSGLTTFKASMSGMALAGYSVSWQIAGDRLNPMGDDTEGAPHKTAEIDLTGWTWLGAGPYPLNFVAKNAAGETVAQQAVNIYVEEVPPPDPDQPVFTVTAPVAGAALSGVTMFRASLDGIALAEYSVSWQIAGDRLNPMADSTEGGPHKAALVDLRGWTWLGAGPYPLNFVAKNAVGETLAQHAVNIYVEQAPPPDPDQPVLIVSAPIQGAQLSGLTTFKAYVEGMALSEYTVSWQIAGDHLNPMADSTEGVPHKDALIDLSGWTWLGTGPYPLNFVARNAAGETIAERAVSIYVTAPTTPDRTRGHK